MTDARSADDLDPGALETDDVNIRTLRESDLEAIIRIDAVASGLPRRDFFTTKVRRSLQDSSVHLSMVAEVDDHVVGFVTVIFHQGEFGRPEPIAVLDAIGVHPEYRHRHVGRALLRQLEMNLAALRVDELRTEVAWDDLDMLGFMARAGFRPAPRLCLAKQLGR